MDNIIHKSNGHSEESMASTVVKNDSIKGLEIVRQGS